MVAPCPRGSGALAAGALGEGRVEVGRRGPWKRFSAGPGRITWRARDPALGMGTGRRLVTTAAPGAGRWWRGTEAGLRPGLMAAAVFPSGLVPSPPPGGPRVRDARGALAGNSTD
jgi:hypothetical protein